MVSGLLDDNEEASIEKSYRHSPLRRQWLYFEAVVRNSPIATVTLDLDARVAACNRAFESLFGYSQEELVGGRLDDFIALQEARQEAEEQTGQAMGSAVHAETLRRRKDGTPVEVELFGVPVSFGSDAVGAALLFDDITERKRTQDWLRLANTALESAANAILICDREGTITWVNPAFTRLTGYTPEEAHGQNMRLLKSGKHDPSYYQNLWDTILAGRVWHGETTNRHKDGSLYVEEQTIAPVRDGRGELTHFISIKNDVTARKQAEVALEQARLTLGAWFRT
jgi:PAS domain S-box-containing protein